jgi:hypothetical protein
MQPLFSLLVVGSFCWFIASSFWIYPHSLSYFNESIGGPLAGAGHLLGSNVDWGQDEQYYLNWTRSRPTQEKVHLAYHGCFDPKSATTDTPWYPYPFPSVEGGRFSGPRAYIVSCNFVQGHQGAMYDGSGHKAFFSGDEFAGIRNALFKETVAYTGIVHRFKANKQEQRP